MFTMYVLVSRSEYVYQDQIALSICTIDQKPENKTLDKSMYKRVIGNMFVLTMISRRVTIEQMLIVPFKFISGFNIHQFNPKFLLVFQNILLFFFLSLNRHKITN